jgi:hypothetical protein
MANIALIDSVPDEKLMVIPDRFHNNIFWQAGHLLTSQASLLYRRTGQPLPVPESYFGYFGKGSSPDNFDSATPGYSEVRKQLEAILETTRKDLPKMLGLPYEKPITVTSGRILVSFDDALEFSALHEALHTGMITAMLKFL